MECHSADRFVLAPQRVLGHLVMGVAMENALSALSREELTAWLQDAAKLWLAHDGLWFQAVEQAHGQQQAIVHDATAWSQFSPLEAKRIMSRLGIAPGGGIPALVTCLQHRLYAILNRQTVVEQSRGRCVFRMLTCRVQDARQRKQLAPFPCREVGLIEYTTFAQTIDPRIRTRCIACPPDDRPAEWWCTWEFTLAGAENEATPPQGAASPTDR
jgi:hypothetical protein